MTDSKNLTTTKHKLTAAQVEQNCPAALQDLGKRIAAHVEKARKCEEKCDQHYRSIGQLLAEVRQVCDDGGFETFRARYCPHLGQSRAYELLAIATDKKSIEDIRASTRARVAKHRAKKAAASVTVTDKLAPEAESAPTEVAPADAPSTVPEQTPEAAKPHRGVTSKDEALSDFTARVCDLVRRAGGQKLERFAATSVSADDLAELGKFLTDLANLKKRSAKPTATVRGNDTVSVEQSAEDMKAKHAAREAGGDQAACRLHRHRKKHQASPASRAAASRKRSRLIHEYSLKFGPFSGDLTPAVERALQRALETGVDQPLLVRLRKETERSWAEYDAKLAAEHAEPFTVELEKHYTARIKGRRLIEGDCERPWQNYFGYRESHPNDVEPLSDDDLQYVGQWTSCGLKPKGVPLQHL